MDVFGLADKIPVPGRVSLPARDVAAIVASATREYPELASSPGVREAYFTDSEIKSSAWVSFEPYRYMDDFSHSLSMYCDVTAAEERTWVCGQAKARNYLTVQEQEAEIVITNELSRQKAVDLVAFTNAKLREEPNYEDMKDWSIFYIRPPDTQIDVFVVALTDGAYGTFSYEVKDALNSSEEQFEVVRVRGNSNRNCGADSI